MGYIYKKIDVVDSAGAGGLFLFIAFIYNLAILMSTLATWEKAINILFAGIAAFAFGALNELGRTFIKKSKQSRVINKIKKIMNGKQNRA